MVIFNFWFSALTFPNINWKSSSGVYAQLYCLLIPKVLDLDTFSPLFSGFLIEFLSSERELWVSVLLILMIQLEHSWLWKSPEVIILYLVSIYLKFASGPILTLARNSSTKSWLWLIMFRRIIFSLYICLILFSNCYFDLSYPFCIFRILFS